MSKDDEMKEKESVALEKRIHRLERVVGSRDITSQPLYPSIQTLKNQLNLLSEGQLKTLEEQLKRITLTFASENLDPKIENETHEKKINQIFETMTKWESMDSQLPLIVSRLKTLKSLHEEAATFAKICGI